MIGTVLEMANSYLENQALVLMAYQYVGLMSVTYKFDTDPNDSRDGYEHFYVKRPWLLNSNILRAGFRRLCAEYFSQTGTPWFQISIGIGEGEGCPYNGVQDHKLIMMRITLDEEITDNKILAEKASKMVSVYRQCKELFTLLDCDAADCYSDGFGSVYWPDPDPDHESKVFRFAKIGRQVHVRMFEDGLPLISRNQASWREVIDP